MTRRIRVAIAAVATGLFNAAAQTPTPARAGFEVASIKLNPACGGGRGSGPPTPGRLEITCASLHDLIQQAYGIFANGPKFTLKRLRITGGPAWLDSDAYTISAKADGGTPIWQMNGPMLQALLEERFALKLHREMREGSVYDLTIAKGGPKLKATPEGGCVPLDLNQNRLPGPQTPGGPHVRYCGSTQSMSNMGKTTMSGWGATMANLAGMLSPGVGRDIIDKTGLTGMFDYHLEFSRDEVRAQVDAGEASMPEGSSLFTAIEEQLGLKLVSAKGPVEYVVIDHIERPTDN